MRDFGKNEGDCRDSVECPIVIWSLLTLSTAQGSVLYVYPREKLRQFQSYRVSGVHMRDGAIVLSGIHLVCVDHHGSYGHDGYTVPVPCLW